MKDWYSRNVSIQEPLKKELVSHIDRNTLKDYNDLLSLANQVRELCALYLACREQSYSPNFLSRKGGMIYYKKHDYWSNGTEFFILVPVFKYNAESKSWNLLLDKPTEHKYYSEAHLQNELYNNIKRELLSHISYFKENINHKN